MIVTKNNLHNRKANNDFEIGQVVSSMKSMEELLKKLSAKVNELPKLDGKSRSECKSAEDQYAEKEEMVDEAVNGLNGLRKQKDKLNREIGRCQHNLKQIQTDAAHLNLNQAKERYSFAKLSQDLEYKKTIRLGKELADLIALSEKVISHAKSKRFPGKKPKKKFQPPPELFEKLAGRRPKDFPGPKHFVPPPFLSPSDNEIDNLISLGPLGNCITNKNS